jgi:hypothetical protein
MNCDHFAKEYSFENRNGLDCAHSSLWKRKGLNWPKNSVRVQIGCTESLRLPERSLSYRQHCITGSRS